MLPGALTPLRHRIEVEAPVTHESRERHPVLAGDLDGEGGGGADSGDDRDPGRQRLLHDLEGCASADHEYAPVERQVTVEEGTADDLVHRIVASDILA